MISITNINLLSLLVMYITVFIFKLISCIQYDFSVI